MSHFFTSRFRSARQGGFTLIELLVVIAIIGVLASIVLASLNTARRKSRDARRVADIKQLQLALELYYDANGQNYPTVLTSLTTGCAGSSPCIPTVPVDPLSAAYTYAALGSGTSCTSYHLGAALEESNTNGPLASDADATVGNICNGSGADFAGTPDTAVCSGTAGASQGSYCYDVKP